MAAFTKLQVLQAMQQTGMVPVFYHSDAEVARQVLKACYEGGVRALSLRIGATSLRKCLLI